MQYLPLNYNLFVFQMRNLIAACITPEPSQRPNIEYVYAISQEMHGYFNSHPTPRAPQRTLPPLPSTVSVAKGCARRFVFNS